nr:hypothetical protein [Tanacetum cinerariifolium]
MSSDSIAPLSPDHPLTHTTPASVHILHKIAHMAVRVLHAMSPGLSADIAEVVAMSDSAFCKRFKSSYDSSPSPPLLVRKRYRGMFELILDTDSKEVEESLDSDSVSEDAEDEGPTAEYEDPDARDEGLAAGDEGLSMIAEIRGLDDEGQGSGSAPEPERSERVSVSRQPTLSTWIDPEDGMVYIDVPAYPPPAPPAQTLPSPDFTCGYLDSHIPVDEDQFIEVGAQLELYRSILQDHTQRLDAMPPTLFPKINKDARAGIRGMGKAYCFAARATEMRGRVTALEQERDHKERSNRKEIDREWSQRVLERVVAINGET